MRDPAELEIHPLRTPTESSLYFEERDTAREIQGTAHKSDANVTDRLAQPLLSLKALSGPPPVGDAVFDRTIRLSQEFRAMPILESVLSSTLMVFGLSTPLSDLMVKRAFAQINPYAPGYAQLVREIKKNHNGAFEPVKYLGTCVDLPVDVQIELMDFVLATSMVKQDPALWDSMKFPVGRMGEITLDSLAAARRVALWLKEEDALREIDRRIQDDAPTVITTSGKL